MSAPSGAIITTPRLAETRDYTQGPRLTRHRLGKAECRPRDTEQLLINSLGPHLQQIEQTTKKSESDLQGAGAFASPRSFADDAVDQNRWHRRERQLKPIKFRRAAFAASAQRVGSINSAMRRQSIERNWTCQRQSRPAENALVCEDVHEARMQQN